MSTEISSPWWSEVEHLRPQREQDVFVDAAAPASRSQAAAPVQREPLRRLPVVRRPGAPKARALIEQRRSRASQRPLPSTTAPKSSLTLRRPDRIAAWAVMLGLVLVLTAAVSASAAPLTKLGDRTLKKPMNGHDVKLMQGKLRKINLLQVAPTGHFGSLTYAAVRRYQRTRCLTVDGVAGPSTIAAMRAGKRSCAAKSPSGGGGGSSSGINRTRVVTWYGPGWYGRRTACGNTLTSRLYGVAHKTLPCGTVVYFRFGGRTVRTKVVDRGPYAAGVHFDLTWAAARKLGVISIGRATVRASR
ncbi:MAG: peptidoglycan-binding protein [Solirubrobacteraceae bacterium]|jgi:rare lipoprotein A (peptidoglycan hydrolase)|nr:peptidoglycan-binding protein [Solirubrobacteraceae bacterium]MDP4673584.1 peptidoglycan-binding protein [Solirubrobacteraceae bacterium]MDP4921200.1 peptidoglycan-binding protein [Solirubrobacteraceae bacterium]